MDTRSPLNKLNDALKDDDISNMLGEYLNLEGNANKHYVYLFSWALKKNAIHRLFDISTLSDNKDLTEFRNNNYVENHHALEQANINLSQDELNENLADSLRIQFENFSQLKEIERQIKGFFDWVKSKKAELKIEDTDITFLYNMMRQDYIANTATSYIALKDKSLTPERIDFIKNVGNYLYPKSTHEDCASLFKKNIINDIVARKLHSKKAVEKYLNEQIKDFQRRSDFLLLSPAEKIQKLINLKKYLLGDLKSNKNLTGNTDDINDAIESVFKNAIKPYEKSSKSSIVVDKIAAVNERIREFETKYVDSLKNDPLSVMQRSQMELVMEKLKAIPTLDEKIKVLNSIIRSPGILGSHNVDTFIGRAKTRLNINTRLVKQLINLRRDLCELNQKGSAICQQGIFRQPDQSPRSGDPSSNIPNKLRNR